VIVYPPSPTGGRRVRVDREILGLAYSVKDVTEFLRRAGLDVDEVDVEATGLIEWRGGGPDVWT
jgi:phenylalanyl-tRNA synthetase beta subunit